MIWGRQNRAVVAQANPDLQNRQISTLLGQIWADLPAEARQPYYDEAPRLQRLFDEQAGECIGKSSPIAVHVKSKQTAEGRVGSEGTRQLWPCFV